LGNFIGIYRCGAENAPLLMIDAHMDEVGLIITSVTDEGFLKFDSLGSPDVRTLINSEVLILGKNAVPGVVCTLPPHLQTAAEMETFPKLTDLSIDVGLTAEEAKKLIVPGTCAVLKRSARQLANGRLTGKAFDNRLCLYAALEAFANAELPADCDIAFVASVREEVGCRGAGAAAFGLAPDACIVLDVTFGAQPDAPASATFALGSGITLCVGPFTDKKLTDKLFDLAERLSIGCSAEVYGGSTGTNASPVQITRAGIPVAVISIPIRNMHTPAELCDPADVESAIRLLGTFITELKGEDLK
ncbi:MAG: M20/M25/M40 family metallo-hydrolase, partial [Clostridia bacterium]|nr:M20/M25/M40 family metallo-hydrolase [Clostridia bacterium]